MKKEQEWLSTKEVCKILKISRATLTNYRTGRIYTSGLFAGKKIEDHDWAMDLSAGIVKIFYNPKKIKELKNAKK